MPSNTQQLKLTYQGKPYYGGVNVDVPESEIDIHESSFIQNCILRNGEIRSRIPFTPLMPGPNDGFPVRGLFNFYDINAVMHTVTLTKNALYQLSANWPSLVQQGVNPWLSVFFFNRNFPDNLFASAILQTNLIFSNGGGSILKWNGLTNVLTGIDALADGTTFGAFYLMELNAKIIAAYTVESKAGVTNIFPFRIRWTVSGVQAISGPNQFDPSVNLGAGFNDEFDVPDIITGILPIGRTGYIYRNNGITEMIPNSTGTGFDFDHLWASDRGIGNVFPQSLAGYGPMNIFIASDDIYKITPDTFDRIGTKVFNTISSDIKNAVGVMHATIIPQFTRDYPYSVYWLSIPLGNNTSKQWIYDLKEKSWTTWFLNNKQLTCKARQVYVG